VPWVALHVPIAVRPLVGIGVVLRRLGRSGRGSPRTAGEAGETVGAASDRLAAAQAAGDRHR
jgi:hypothetical protein